MAIKRSLGESMIRQPTIPAALHPKPMHMSKEIYASHSFYHGHYKKPNLPHLLF
jgi:hypothetical protein